MWEKLKLLLTDDALYFSLLVVLVGGASFGLGRMSVESTAVAPATPPVAVTGEPTPVSSDGVSVVASENGTKYHLPDCPSVDRIKVENRVEFATAALAQAAGYEPAANCPGL